MPQAPKISAALQKDHPGEVAISLDGKVIGVGKTSTEALKEAKKKIPDIEKKEFLVSRIYNKYIAA
jgi:uncharacterized protein YktB (UPF0637 family)